MVSSTKVDSKVNLIARMPTINRFWSTERVEKPAIIFCKQSEVSTVHCMLRKAMRSLARGNEVPMNSSPSMSMSITCIVLEVSRLANLSQLWFIYPTLLKLQDFKIPNFRTTKARVSKTLLTPKTPWPNTSSRNICHETFAFMLWVGISISKTGPRRLEMPCFRSHCCEAIGPSRPLQTWSTSVLQTVGFFEHFFEGRMLDYPK